MYYIIKAADHADTLERRLAARADHVERLQQLQEQGRLLVAGPIPAIDADDPGPAGYRGSLVIAEFDSHEDAASWANADPYVAAGVYAEVTVLPFHKAFP